MTSPEAAPQARRGATASSSHALRLTFEELRAHQLALLTDLRALMEETQVQSARLRTEWTGGPSEASTSLASRLEHKYAMTPREIDVALLLADGLSNTAIARRLRISPHTARHHTQRVLGKLGVHSRAEAGARLRR